MLPNLVLETSLRQTDNLMTKRLRLEPLQTDHADAVFEAMQNTEMYTYVPQDPPQLDELRKRYAFLEGAQSPDGLEQWLNWVAFLDNSQTPVGSFQATVRKGTETAIAYSVFRPFWRQGYAQEMAHCIIPHLFEAWHCPGLFAEIDTRNTGSIRLVESIGFQRRATTRNADFFKGATSDEYRYSMTREAWYAGTPA